MARRVRSRHYGGSLALPGGGSGIYAKTAPDVSLDPGSGSLTVALRFKCRSLTGATHIIAEYSAAYNTEGFLINQYANTILFYVKSGAAQLSCYIPDTSWHDWVFVADASDHSMRIYMDGVQVAYGPSCWTSPITATSKVFTLGSGGEVPACTNGLITEAVYDVGHAWTAAQADAHHFEGTVPASATNLWPMDDGAGTTARATRGGLALTLSGGPSFSGDSPMIGRGIVRNFVAQSKALTTAPWVPSGGVFTAFGGTKPSGVGGMTTITDNASGLANIYQAPSSAFPTSGRGLVILSAFVTKVSGSGWLAMSVDGGNNVAWFNVGTGAVGNLGGGNPTTALEATDVAGVYRLTYALPLGTFTGMGYPRFYNVNGNGVVTHTLGDAVAVGGVMVEMAVPGQTTPSPYVATGAAPLSVFGLREWRQNLLVQCNRPDLSPWFAATATPPTIVTGLADPEGKTRAFSVQDFSATEFQGPEQIFLGATSGDKKHTFCVYVKKTVGATNTVGVSLQVYGGTPVPIGARMNPNTGATIGAASGTVVDAGAWWLWSMTVQNNATNSNVAVTLYPSPGTIAGGDSVAATGTTIFALPRLFQGAGPFASHIDTTSAPANSSGAPRSIAL